MLPALALGGGCHFLLGPDDAHPTDVAMDGSGLAVDDALDGAESGAATTGADGLPPSPTRLDCDLLLQVCMNRGGCYPDESFLGNTICQPHNGGGPPLSTCTQQTDCAPRLVCITSVSGSADMRSCVELCRTSGDDSGCPPGLQCAPLPAYPGVGYCRY